MRTLCLSIIHKDIQHKGYYIPAKEGFKVGFRSENTKINALKKLSKAIRKHDFIQNFIIEEYEGKYEGYNKNELLYSYTIDDLADFGIKL